MPRTTLSRRISRLEEYYGLRLVHRTTRALTLTDAGQEVFSRGQGLVRDADALDASIKTHSGTIRGLVRVSGPKRGGLEVDEMYASFVRDHPDVRLEIKATAHRVDLIAEGIDVAIRGGDVGDEGLIGRKVQVSRASLFASSDYLSRRGLPQSPQDLDGHELLLGYGGGERVVTQWPLLNGGTIEVRARIAANDLSTILHMIIGGMGIGMVPEFLLKSELKAETVVRVLSNEVARDVGLYVLYPDREYLQPQVRAFVDHACTWISGLDLGQVPAKTPA